MKPNDRPRVIRECVSKQHRCQTCYDRLQYIKKRGIPKDMREQMLRLMKIKPFTIEELSKVFDMPVEAIITTMSELKKAGLISMVEGEDGAEKN
jgi:predicted Rossmann fold nucleotide-binding protein DprA/Smf involved in DNA uptake